MGKLARGSGKAMAGGAGWGTTAAGTVYVTRVGCAQDGRGGALLRRSEDDEASVPERGVEADDKRVEQIHPRHGEGDIDIYIYIYIYIRRPLCR